MQQPLQEPSPQLARLASKLSHDGTWEMLSLVRRRVDLKCSRNLMSEEICTCEGLREAVDKPLVNGVQHLQEVKNTLVANSAGAEFRVKASKHDWYEGVMD